MKTFRKTFMQMLKFPIFIIIIYILGRISGIPELFCCIAFCVFLISYICEVAYTIVDLSNSIEYMKKSKEET